MTDRDRAREARRAAAECVAYDKDSAAWQRWIDGGDGPPLALHGLHAARMAEALLDVQAPLLARIAELELEAAAYRAAGDIANAAMVKAVGQTLKSARVGHGRETALIMP